MEQVKLQVAEYSVTEAALAALRAELAGKTFDVTTKEGMAAARAARFKLVKLRTALDDKRKEIKAPVLKQARLIDSEANRITTELLNLEEPIDQQIQAFERVEAQRKAEAARADQERRNGILQRIADMERLPNTMVGAKAQRIADLLDVVRGDNPAKWAQEFLVQAAKVHGETVGALERMHTGAKAAEEEAARQATERERLAKEAADLTRRQAEQRAAEENAKAEREAEERAAKERAERTQMSLSEITGIRQQVIIAQAGRLGVRIGGTLQCIEETLAETEAWPVTRDHFGEYTTMAEAAKTETVAQIKALREAAIATEAKEAALKAQQDRLDEERRAKEEAERKVREEQEAKERAARMAEEDRQRQERLALERRQREEQEAREAVEREVRRKEQERLDGRQMLETFLEQYGELPEFGYIVVAIRSYFDKRKAA